MSGPKTWMPLFVGDYLGDTGHLTTAQHGAYLLLLMHQWRCGSIPNDPTQLARLCRCTRSTWTRHIAPAVLAFFQIEGDQLTYLHLFRVSRANCASGRGACAA